MIPNLNSQIKELLYFTSNGYFRWDYFDENFIRGVKNGTHVKLVRTKLNESNDEIYQYELFLDRETRGGFPYRILSNPNLYPEYIPLFNEIFELAKNQYEIEVVEVFDKLIEETRRRY